MERIAKFICQNRLLIIIISIILLVLSFIGMHLTKINYDILLYLPREFETIKGQEILTNDFNMGGYSIATVENMPAKDILILEGKIKNVDGVANVVSLYDAIGTSIPVEMVPSEVRNKLNKDNIDVLFITFKESTSSDSTITAVSEIRKITDGVVKQGGMSSLILDTRTLSQKEITVYIIIAVILCILVLQISLDSYLVPFILLINIGCAILFNLGTNVFLGQISYITKALVAVLQLGVTTDFSIFLYHSYEEKKKNNDDREEAMSLAIKDTFLSVTGSSLTTIVGFLALCAMRLTLGRDLGIVMAKGVLLGVITVLTLFPSLLLFFDNLIQKTKHKEIIPNFNSFNTFLIKHYKKVFIIFILLLIPSYLAYRKVNVYYKLDSSLPKTLESIKTNELLKDKFDLISLEIILINKDLKSDDVIKMTERIRNLKGIDFALSFRELQDKGLNSELLPKDISNLFTSDKYEMILINSKYDIATNELNNQIDELNKIVKAYDKEAIVAGEGPLTKDLVETYATDYKYVNLFSIGCIFIVLLFVLKSFSLPLLLIIAIEFAIFMNLGYSYLNGTILPFIAPITLGTIQLGATIDYAILVTTTYLSKRKNGLDKEEAILKTMNYAAPSILISGMCFFAATCGVGIYSNIAMIGSICSLISRGALISVMVVLTILPSILLVFDKIIFKNQDKGRRKMFKKVNVSLLLIGLILPIKVNALEKNEYVYGKLGYQGNIKSITVNNQIINNKKLDKIDDYSELKNILNIKNSATYSSKDNQIVWDANGNDIFYTGTTNKELPVSLKITYMLNNKEVKPEDILGKSGKVTIKLKYTNKDKHGNLYTPFVVTLGTIIDGKNNSNIKVVNGKVINNGSNYMLVGIATPGLYQSLNLKEFKNMDVITISYDTTKFEVPSMYNVITSKLIDQNDLTIFNKMDSLYEKVNTMQDGMNKIETGAKNLNTGLVSLQSQYDKFNTNLNTINTNFYTLNNGVQELQKEVNNVLNNENVKKMKEMLPTLEEDANKIKDITNKYGDDINKYVNVSNKVVDGVTEDILNIIKYLETLEDYLNNNTDITNVINEGVTNLNNHLSSIDSILENIQNYLSKINKISSFTSSSVDYIINTYESNMEAASPELKKLYEEALVIKNSEELNNITNSLDKDLNALNKLKASIQNGKEKLDNILSKLQDNNKELNDKFNEVKDSASKLKELETKVKNANSKIHNNINLINKGVEVVNNLPTEIHEVNTGIDQFANGINKISDGTNKLYEGINTLSGYSNNINEGIKKLASGSTELSNGISTFNSEGINKLSSLVNGNVKKTVNNVKKLITLGNNYSSFTGTKINNSSTRFIMVTDSLKVPELKEEVKEEKTATLWDRIKGLFI